MKMKELTELTLSLVNLLASGLLNNVSLLCSLPLSKLKIASNI